MDEEFDKREDNGFVTGGGGDVLNDDEGAGDDARFVEPNRPRISSIVDFRCCCWETGREVVRGEDPNISARRS